MICRSCGSKNLREVLNLGSTPWCNDFITKDLIGKETFYPLNVLYCMNCTLVQLSHTVPKEKMFSRHTYVSGTTKTLATHFMDLAKSNVKDFRIEATDLIVDIGGNDGTQMLQYKKLGIKNTINVESAENIGKISEENGINTIIGFFNDKLARKEFLRGSAKLINASGVMFHLEELHSVLRGIEYLLAKNGVFVIQFMYLKDIVDNLAFDAIYHEHLCYYTLKSLNTLLKIHNLQIHDSFHSAIHGGSMVVIVKHKSCEYATFSHAKMFREENCTYSSVINFAKNVVRKRDNLRNVLRVLKKDGATIYGYGAPAKSTTLLHYLRIDNTLIDKMVEINKLKCGLYTPGTHIPIVEEDSLDIPDYYLLLAWNFKAEIFDKNRGSDAVFITPFPEVILNKV